MRPAWSEAFTPDVLSRVAPLGAPAPMTRDWAWGGADGAGVAVAIVDSGVDASHPAVGSVERYVAIDLDPDHPGEVRLGDGPHDDLYGHGTACAGIIRRVAPRAQLHSVRVLDTALKSKGAVFLRGVRWALDAGVHVVNLSLSTSNPQHRDALHELVDEAYFRGVVLVSAITNRSGPSYPSQFGGVVSVAAHDRRDPFGFDYNPRPPVEFGAPGIDVPVAWIGGTTVRGTGNSFAAAHVAGLVARILSKHPGLTPFQVKTVLHGVADNAGARPASS